MEGVGSMDKYGCDYACKTVGESITKYHIPDDWCAEFDAYDGVYPTVCIQVSQIRKSSPMMALKLKIVENEDDEYAGCMLLPSQKTVVFKVDHMKDLVKAMRNRQADIDDQKSR